MTNETNVDKNKMESLEAKIKEFDGNIHSVEKDRKRNAAYTWALVPSLGIGALYSSQYGPAGIAGAVALGLASVGVLVKGCIGYAKRSKAIEKLESERWAVKGEYKKMKDAVNVELAKKYEAATELERQKEVASADIKVGESKHRYGFSYISNDGEIKCASYSVTYLGMNTEKTFTVSVNDETPLFFPVDTKEIQCLGRTYQIEKVSPYSLVLKGYFGYK